MNNIRFRILDMSSDIDKKTLLTYFFKKLDTVLDKDELLTMSCIYYDSEKQNISSRTNRFINQLEPLKNQKVLNEDVDDTLKSVVGDSLKIQEELVRCDLHLDTGTDHFYIAVIGVDFFMTEKEFGK